MKYNCKYKLNEHFCAIKYRNAIKHLRSNAVTSIQLMHKVVVLNSDSSEKTQRQSDEASKAKTLLAPN